MKADKWIINNFLSPEECTELIQRGEKQGFSVANVSTPTGPVINLEYRNNDRVIFDNPKLAAYLWSKLKDDPKLINPGWTAIGLNDKFRIYRYLATENHYFAAHYDASYEKVPLEVQSWATILIYLNEDFEGGETVFLDAEGKPEAWTPRTGMAGLMTQHNILHEAKPCTKGTKYALRTDIMYQIDQKPNADTKLMALKNEIVKLDGRIDLLTQKRDGLLLQLPADLQKKYKIKKAIEEAEESGAYEVSEHLSGKYVG